VIDYFSLCVECSSAKVKAEVLLYKEADRTVSHLPLHL